MKIIHMKENLVRSFIRNVLNESLSPVARADEAGLAVAFGEESDIQFVIIYDPVKMEEYLATRDAGDINTFRGKELNALIDLGVIRSCVSYEPSSNPCNGAFSIRMSVSFAGSGMGPAAYDIAMWRSENGLFADRIGVSSDAQKIWQKYDKRTDVEKSNFDDIEKPITEPTGDDCAFYKIENDPIDFLNKSYNILSEPAGLDDMMKRHNKCYKNITADGFEDMIPRLISASRALFRERK